MTRDGAQHRPGIFEPGPEPAKKVGQGEGRRRRSWAKKLPRLAMLGCLVLAGGLALTVWGVGLPPSAIGGVATFAIPLFFIFILM